MVLERKALIESISVELNSFLKETGKKFAIFYER